MAFLSSVRINTQPYQLTQGSHGWPGPGYKGVLCTGNSPLRHGHSARHARRKFARPAWRRPAGAAAAATGCLLASASELSTPVLRVTPNQARAAQPLQARCNVAVLCPALACRGPRRRAAASSCRGQSPAMSWFTLQPPPPRRAATRMAAAHPPSPWWTASRPQPPSCTRPLCLSARWTLGACAPRWPRRWHCSRPSPTGQPRTRRVGHGAERLLSGPPASACS